MKSKILSTLLLFVALAFTQVVEAGDKADCQGPVAIRAESLVGNWKEIGERYHAYFTLGRDGTFKGRIEENNKTVWQYAGTWTLKGDVLRWVYTTSSLKGIAPGTVDEDKVLEITCTSATFRNQGGRTGIFHRTGN